MCVYAEDSTDSKVCVCVLLGRKECIYMTDVEKAIRCAAEG